MAPQPKIKVEEKDLSKPGLTMTLMPIQDLSIEQLSWAWAVHVEGISNPHIDTRYSENEAGNVDGVITYCSNSCAYNWENLSKISEHGVDIECVSDASYVAASVHNNLTATGGNILLAAMKVYLMDELEGTQVGVPYCLKGKVA